MLGRLVAAAVFVAGTVSAQEAREPVDLELVLLADASGSIDDVETRLQRQGYAEAMGDPQVLWAIENGGEHGRIAVVFVEWAGARSQDVVVDWTVIDDEASAEAFGDRLLAAPRRADGTNAIGAAILQGAGADRGQPLRGLAQGHRPLRRQHLEPAPADDRRGPRRRDRAGRGGERARHPVQRLLRPARGRRPRADFTDQLIGGPGAFVVTAERARGVRGGGASQAHPGDRGRLFFAEPLKAGPAQRNGDCRLIRQYLPII